MTTKPRNTLTVSLAARLTLLLTFIQTVLALLSWIANTVDAGVSVRSLLAADGVRWFFNTFTANVTSAPLAWLVLLSIAWGAVRASGLHSALSSRKAFRTLSYRSRHALASAFAVVLLMLLCVILLAFIPHALLLSVTGGLFPSPFFNSLVPAAAFIMTSSSIVYGLQSGKLTSLNDVFRCLYYGLHIGAPLFPLYIMAIELYHSVRFVFGI